jgi:hypothetical protein
MSKIDQELKDKLEAVLAQGVSEDCMKAIKKATDDILYTIETDLDYRLKDDLAPYLVAWVADMATKAIEQLLEGNKDQMRRYLGCEKRGDDGKYISWTGRSDSSYWGRQRVEDWHPVIHGKLHEQGVVALRKKLVDAHRDIITSERILDLEDQVKSLVAQLNRKEAECEGLRQRIRETA